MSDALPHTPEFIYKIATVAAYAAAEASGRFTGMPVDVADGYIHFSTAAQVEQTLSLHFRGLSDLVLIAVRTADVGSELVWETSRAGQLFPHLYAPFPTSAVAWAEPVSVAADGSCNLPAAVR